MAPTIDAANNAIAISVFTFGFSFFWLMFWTHQEHKKTADLHQAAESGDFLVREIALPHIDPCGSRHLAVSNDRLPDSVYRIAPDALIKQ
jgi:hypothetical protein